MLLQYVIQHDHIIGTCWLSGMHACMPQAVTCCHDRQHHNQQLSASTLLRGQIAYNAVCSCSRTMLQGMGVEIVALNWRL